MTTGKKTRGTRASRVRIKSAKRRGASSRRWLERQINDPYVIQAKAEGYRSRAAYKLRELDDRFHILAPGSRVVDLGAAPGGWTQVAVERARAGDNHSGRVVAVDINGMEPVPDADIIEADVLVIDTPALIRAALDGPADIVLSDMAAPATGHADTDRLRIIGHARVVVAAPIEHAGHGRAGIKQPRLNLQRLPLQGEIPPGKLRVGDDLVHGLAQRLD